jgi:hypothetical protein
MKLLAQLPAAMPWFWFARTWDGLPRCDAPASSATAAEQELPGFAIVHPADIQNRDGGVLVR